MTSTCDLVHVETGLQRHHVIDTHLFLLQGQYQSRQYEQSLYARRLVLRFCYRKGRLHWTRSHVNWTENRCKDDILDHTDRPNTAAIGGCIPLHSSIRRCMQVDNASPPTGSPIASISRIRNCSPNGMANKLSRP
ncbi:hypothetical protein CEXT_514091 [Caerostris extrusa]|uniref:Uncharacterized protein n=1 Tax=Caerostris extrusa TaxID=172846 RepID=A0AAV4N982_CAEEX|nr:hypothetical protein CEXT_514091 [Caerostris extrusa]